MHSEEYEDSDGCSYGESNTSNWEYHPEHIDGEVGLVVDEVLGMQGEHKQQSLEDYITVTEHYKLLDYWRNIYKIL